MKLKYILTTIGEEGVKPAVSVGYEGANGDTIHVVLSEAASRAVVAQISEMACESLIGLRGTMNVY
jgi:hypothetical protein